jgi:LEA14-like dessication related protein
VNKKYLPIVIIVLAVIIGFAIFAFMQSSIVDVSLEKVKVGYVRYGGVEIDNVVYGSVGTLDVTLKMTNPNNESVTVKEIRCDIFCNDEQLGWGDHYKKRIEIPANSTKVVHMPYEFKLASYADCSYYLRTAQSWKIEGTLYTSEPKEAEISFEDQLEA